jgi:hypothetical protein
MHDTFFNHLIEALQQLCSNAYALLAGLFTSIIGYFMPVKDIVNLLLLFFILDVIFGFWAAKKLRNERFSVKIIWSHTIPRMLISIVLIIGAYMWDKTYNQDIVSTYKVIGWFISGVLLYSIAENGYLVTKWTVFPRLSEFLKSKVKENTGIEVDTKNVENG